MARKTYGSDLTDKQWKLIEPHIPTEKDFGRPRITDMREVINALFYMLRTGYQWDMMFQHFSGHKDHEFFDTSSKSTGVK